ncbi:MAG: bifunctional heptose 7-phosphate kinase/heptose 1-phosphate adenyltransferase [Phycisphaerae bacterium]|nr:bifunctional heptose 7-phosphate kinase/heptose 1-phosphate adenyltransferase [Phycisphaerae bacterium]
MHELLERLERFGSPRVALVGDFMLDRYVYGQANRLSQEAPVPVLRALRSATTPGGAGNVASALLALGARAICIGLIGHDQAGDELKDLLTGAGAQISGLVRLAKFATVVKTRYVGLGQHRNPQQLLRVDQEDPATVSDTVRGTLRAALRGELRHSKTVVIQDYDKGALNETNTPQIIADARKAGAAVVVDPAGIRDYRRYVGATLLKPNRYEAEVATGISIVDEVSLERAARQLILAADLDAVAISLDKDGVYLCVKGSPGRHFPPPRALTVYDITGAGDVLVAMLALALGEGCDFAQAVTLGNLVGGMAVERFGPVPVQKEEVLEELRRLTGLRGRKLRTHKQLLDEITRRRRAGQTLVFTNGVFDLLHMGHLRYLRQARQLGSCLVVAINSDASARRLKGARRPVIGQDERAEMLGALECVDFVTIFDEDTPKPLLELLKPDVLVKGGSTDQIVGHEIVEKYGGRVRKLELVSGLSTTDIINRVLTSHNSPGARRS